MVKNDTPYDVGLNNFTNIPIDLDNLFSKKNLTKHFLRREFSESIKMFEYGGLPETIPHQYLELGLQLNGYQIIDKTRYKDKDELFTFFGGLGGLRDFNYQPTKATINNPYLRYNAIKDIGENCILARNDYLMSGYLINHTIYATALADGWITLVKSLVNARAEYVPTATNDAQKTAWDEFYKRLREGLDIGCVTDINMMKQVTSLPFNSNAMNTIKASMESIQFAKGQFYNSIGLQASFNGKREYISEAETGMNDDTLIPSPDEMLECRKKWVEEVNAMYGTNITVDYGSIWKEEKENREIAKKTMKETQNNPQEEKESAENEKDQ